MIVFSQLPTVVDRSLFFFLPVKTCVFRFLLLTRKLFSSSLLLNHNPIVTEDWWCLCIFLHPESCQNPNRLHVHMNEPSITASCFLRLQFYSMPLQCHQEALWNPVSIIYHSQTTSFKNLFYKRHLSLCLCSTTPFLSIVLHRRDKNCNVEIALLSLRWTLTARYLFLPYSEEKDPGTILIKLNLPLVFLI